MNYLFFKWSEQEESEYRELWNSDIEKVYSEKGVGSDPIERTKHMLRSLDLSERNYESMIEHEGRPEILSELELIFLQTHI